MMKKSWVCTIVTQVSLCLSLYLVLNLCQNQKPILRNGNDNIPMDIYFISVSGGVRPLEEQTLLLKQVEKVAKKFNARFVINISELGEDDPLVQNATRHFPSTKIPWYSTRALKGQGLNHYLRQFKFAHGSLDIIVVDTGLYQDASNGAGDGQSQWLVDTLENSESKWCIAVGIHPLVACEDDATQMELKHEFRSLHGVFLKYGVDAYISGQACDDNVEKGPVAKTKTGTTRYKGPLLTKVNQNLPYSMQNVNGFLLHKVSALEIVSYLVSLEGDVVQKIFLHQRGKDIM
ncbi:PREDICTED: uncharacterized protein LOC109226450 [Nicotiana attenuata]|uniref:Calcineurin-like phosphoesterase domain-containing protein n=1 Tax=Nicotiana attenuata TaxID=49451 RepID=A0A1J6I972_NICAT|nr:PREDICTED: uncharacterized protein LOC109226450 [Nicotiana attenuata]OIT01526.1 hypothetical protein A4A49_32648 [Nicotiana attenuata]